MASLVAVQVDGNDTIATGRHLYLWWGWDYWDAWFRLANWICERIYGQATATSQMLTVAPNDACQSCRQTVSASRQYRQTVSAVRVDIDYGYWNRG